jgi:hypothetical protein
MPLITGGATFKKAKKHVPEVGNSRLYGRKVTRVREKLSEKEVRVQIDDGGTSLRLIGFRRLPYLSKITADNCLLIITTIVQLIFMPKRRMQTAIYQLLLNPWMVIEFRNILLSKELALGNL